jgi:hypothetical protein
LGGTRFEVVKKPLLKLSTHHTESILLNEKNKGESAMKSFFFILAQLTLVTIVYAFAYRAGYREAQSNALSVVKKFADPATCLLDQLNESADKEPENEDEAKD